MYSDFDELNFCNVESRVDYVTVNMMFNVFHGIAPDYLCAAKLNDHNIRTRHSDSLFIVPHDKTHLGAKSFYIVSNCGIIYQVISNKLMIRKPLKQNVNLSS